MELWKPIPGYEGLYEASNLGRIRTAEGKTTSSARFKKRVWKQRIMKLKYQQRKRSSHFTARVCLWKDGKEKTLLVSRLVAMAWCDGYKEGLTVNHKDGDSLNDRADNLEWISLADNIRHGFANNLYSSQKQCVLIDSKGVRKIFSSQCEASRSLGRQPSYICQCKARNRQAKSKSGDAYDIA